MKPKPLVASNHLTVPVSRGPVAIGLLWVRGADVCEEDGADSDMNDRLLTDVVRHGRRENAAVTKVLRTSD